MSGDESQNDSRDGSVASGGFQTVDVGPTHDVFGQRNNFFFLGLDSFYTSPKTKIVCDQTI